MTLVKFVAGMAVAGLLVMAASGCGSSSSGTSGSVVKWYVFNEPSGGYKQAAANCSKGKPYRVEVVSLPTDANQQRELVVRRLAAKDKDIDIIGMDVIWTAEFAEAGWIRPWSASMAQQASQGVLPGPLATARFKGRLWTAPFTSNTQLLWYRKDLVKTPPKTWAEMIAQAKKLGAAGRIEEQGAKYEGLTVWFNTMVASAGGTILNPNATSVTLGAPAVRALSIMKQLATSRGADPSLTVQMENDNRLAMEAGTAAFQLNYPFVYPGMKTDNPKLFKHFKWALYPEVTPGVPAKVTIGGTDLAVSAYSQHKALAFQAALCLRDRQNQLVNANVGGTPPTITSLYNDPALFANYPFHADILTALENASVRPKTPVYQVASIAISHLISPASGISPVGTEKSMVSQLNDALQSKGLVP